MRADGIIVSELKDCRDPMRHAPLSDADYALLTSGVCPDCGATDLAYGPRVTSGDRLIQQNIACRCCGMEYNWASFMALRNTSKGQPNRERLREVFGIELPDSNH